MFGPTSISVRVSLTTIRFLVQLVVTTSLMKWKIQKWLKKATMMMMMMMMICL